MKYIYSVIRFVPNPSTEEFLNIGMIVGSDASGEWAFKNAPDLARAKRLGSRNASFAPVYAHLENIIEYTIGDSEFNDVSLKMSEETLLNFVHDYNNTLQFSQPLPVLGNSVSEAMEYVFDQFIISEEPTANDYETKVKARTRVKHTYLNLGFRRDQDFFEGIEVHSKHFKARFDFVVANGQAVQLTQAWSFQVNNVIEDLKAWAWTVRDLRQADGSAMTEKRAIGIPLNVDVAAVYIPPKTIADDMIIEQARYVCEEAEVRMVPIADVFSEVGQYARQALESAGVTLSPILPLK